MCQPTPPPIYVLKDIFGRFGHLIDVYMLGGRSCGYAKYADKESADRALMVKLKTSTKLPQLFLNYHYEIVIL